MLRNERKGNECPEPGVYSNVPFDIYREWNAVNHSKLARIDKSPLHARTPVDLSQSKSIRFGHLVHSGRLEPNSVESRYAVMPAYELMSENVTSKGEPSTSTSTAFVKDSRRVFYKAAELTGRTVVTAEEYEQMQETLSVILRCRRSAECFSDGESELSIVWTDKETGVKCKARIDYKRRDRITDLKTSRDESSRPLPESFEWSLWTYNYYSQAAWYQAGWKALTGEILPFWFCVVANTHPIQCVAAPVGEVSLIAGRKKNRERLQLWAECVKANSWPGYESPELFELPEKYLIGMEN